MKNKIFSLTGVVFLLSASLVPVSYAEGLKEGAASFILPTTGQAMNDQLGDTKTKVMAGIEATAVTTLAIIGGTVGGGAVWWALGPLVANHAWSAADAYRSAHGKRDPILELQMREARRSLEFSRERRFERDQAEPDIRSRVARAGEER